MMPPTHRLRRWLARWCWPCVAFGVGLLAIAAAASAQSVTSVAEPIFNARDIILALVGLISALCGAFVAGARSRLDKLETTVDDIEKLVYRDYLNKADTQARFDALDRKLTEGVSSLHSRLDRLNAPRATGG